MYGGNLANVLFTLQSNQKGEGVMWFTILILLDIMIF